MEMPCPRKFYKEMAEAERFGGVCIRETWDAAMGKSSDCDYLIMLSQLLLRFAGQAAAEVAGTYLLLYHNLCDHAREVLAPVDYHRFCEKQAGLEYLLYV